MRVERTLVGLLLLASHWSATGLWQIGLQPAARIAIDGTGPRRWRSWPRRYSAGRLSVRNVRRRGRPLRRWTGLVHGRRRWRLRDGTGRPGGPGGAIPPRHLTVVSQAGYNGPCDPSGGCAARLPVRWFVPGGCADGGPVQLRSGRRIGMNGGCIQNVGLHQRHVWRRLRLHAAGLDRSVCRRRRRRRCRNGDVADRVPGRRRRAGVVGRQRLGHVRFDAARDSRPTGFLSRRDLSLEADEHSGPRRAWSCIRRWKSRRSRRGPMRTWPTRRFRCSSRKRISTRS